jgi:hypothetical protein
MSKNSQNFEVFVPAPILTTAFRWFAVFGILASLLVGVSAALSPVEHRVFLIYVTFGIVAFVILCFGIAEITHKLAKIEFSASQSHAILASLERIERHLEGIRGGDEVNVVIKKVDSKK